MVLLWFESFGGESDSMSFVCPTKCLSVSLSVRQQQHHRLSAFITIIFVFITTYDGVCVIMILDDHVRCVRICVHASVWLSLSGMINGMRCVCLCLSLCVCLWLWYLMILYCRCGMMLFVTVLLATQQRWMWHSLRLNVLENKTSIIRAVMWPCTAWWRRPDCCLISVWNELCITSLTGIQPS